MVQGHNSDVFTIQDEVFQGTVFGLPLWNVFFKCIDDTVRQCFFQVAKFADELTAYRNYRSSNSNDQIQEDFRKCRQACHLWGVQRRVSFDASKEHFCILHKVQCSGDSFRLLGVMVDTELTMEEEINRIMKSATQDPSYS